FTDNDAPANSTVKYTVIADTVTTIGSVDGVVHTVQLPHLSNVVEVVTPVPAPPRWALNPDAEPAALAPDSEVLLFIPGMDSRAEEADDITKAIFTEMAKTSTSPPSTPPSALPPIKSNYSAVLFNNCPNPAGGCPETCDHPDDLSSGKPTAVVPFDITN